MFSVSLTLTNVFLTKMLANDCFNYNFNVEQK